jgi:mevalonate kinase
MKKTFYSNGKLLITGEYLVLNGAKAFALPTKFGQSLNIEETTNQTINWKSYDQDGSVWFEDEILFSEIKNGPTAETESRKNTLIRILHHSYKLNPEFLNTDTGYTISTELSFPRKWGLGTSSTLINNIAQWLNIDAFELLNKSFGGSGYDIACAQNNGPILYYLEQGKPKIERVTFNPDFTYHIYFVYLNKKQSSKAAIANYKALRTHNLEKIIAKNDIITFDILEAKTIEAFTAAIQKHEAEMSVILETNTVKETLFPDFNGTLKSLGAWGGDFIMAISEEDPSDYFALKGYQILLPYKEMILNSVQE